MIDFAKENPAVGDVKLEMNGSEVNLHPILGIAACACARNREPNPKDQACFLARRNCGRPARSSRTESPSQIALRRHEAETELLALETLIFERDAALLRTSHS